MEEDKSQAPPSDTVKNNKRKSGNLLVAFPVVVVALAFSAVCHSERGKTEYELFWCKHFDSEEMKGLCKNMDYSDFAYWKCKNTGPENMRRYCNNPKIVVSDNPLPAGTK